MKNLKEKLEYHYKYFDKSKIEPDPIQFPHQFKNYNDIEIMAFIASIFAYGNIKQINLSLNEFLKLFNKCPYDFILDYNSRVKINFQHRFYSHIEIEKLLLLLQSLLKKYKSLNQLFLEGYSYNDKNLKEAISNFSKRLLAEYQNKFGRISNAAKFMFPLPEKGSACKRMNLFLRWMVRKDEVDFGLWQEIPKNKLIIPVDTHIAKISQELKLTSRKIVSWKMAEEITDNLKKFDAEDPVKYDFALCHLGIRKLKF